jgi:branched-chain amino acid transport system substrate-binding protein
LVFFISISFSTAITLGIALSFEGMTSEFSEDQLKAIEMANAAFPSYKNIEVKLLINDMSSNIKNATINLINNGALSIVGYPISSQALKIINIIEKRKIPVILTTATNFVLTFGKKYVFMTTPSDKQEAEAISDFIVKNFKNPRIAFVYNANQLYCNGIISRIHSYLKERSFVFQQKNYNLCNNEPECAENIIDSLKKYNPDVIFFSSYFEVASSLLKLISEDNLKSTLIFSSSFDDKEFIDFFPKKENIYLCSLDYSIKNKGVYNKVSSKYEELYSKPMDLFAFMAYDSYLIFFEALKECVDSGKPLNRENLNFYIHNLNSAKSFEKKFKFEIKSLKDLFALRYGSKENR